MSRSVYLDFGANAGDTIADYQASARPDLCWGFEPNPRLAEALRARFADQPVQIIEQAVWTEEGTMPLYLGHPLSSTLLEGKVALEYFPQYAITYDEAVEVGTVDIARWLREHVRADDFVSVKMDIEGAEYAVLQHLLDDGAIDLVDELRCEFHAARFPHLAHRHDQILRDVASRTRLLHWV